MRAIARVGLRYGSSKAWINRHVNDGFVQKATRENLRSRSAYKLQELQEKHKFIRPGSVVLDLGAAPGGWSLMASKVVDTSQGGLLIGLDLLPMEPVPFAHILQGDFTLKHTQEEIRKLISGRTVDVVLSDMLSNTTGHASTDHFRSMDLVHTVLGFSRSVLGRRGTLLCKYLRGEDEKEMLERCKEVFGTVKVVKPSASRSESREAYLLARDLKTWWRLKLLAVLFREYFANIAFCTTLKRSLGRPSRTHRRPLRRPVRKNLSKLLLGPIIGVGTLRRQHLNRSTST